MENEAVQHWRGEVQFGLDGLVEDGMIRLTDMSPEPDADGNWILQGRDGYTYCVNTGGGVVREGHGEVEVGNGCLLQVQKYGERPQFGVLFFPFRTHREMTDRTERRTLP